MAIPTGATYILCQYGATSPQQAARPKRALTILLALLSAPNATVLFGHHPLSTQPAKVLSLLPVLAISLARDACQPVITRW